MADYQRVVEFLRDLRQGPLQEVTEEIRQAATDYAALCVQANDRLRKCSTFLQQGLRSEAIHLADETPNLLDLVAALDLPDPQAWTEFCQNNGLPVPPPLQMDRASQLNEAYALDQPLEHLLAQHRLLALARGPIRQRLSILRQIAAVDAGNTSWERDIRTFEKARLKELPTAFYNAVRTRDDAGISSLMQEITQTPWLEPMPADLSTAVADAFHRMQKAKAEAELRTLLDPMREAYAAQSFQECQAIVQRWKNIMDAHGVTIIGTDLTEEILPVLKFVQETEKREEHLRKFRDSCKGFRQLLDIDANDAQLEAAYARVQAFHEPVPEELTARYNDKRAARQHALERKHRTRLILIGSSVAGLAVVLIVLFFMLTRSSNERKWAQEIDQTVATKSAANLAAAQQLVDRLRKTSPSFLAEPTVAAAVRRVDSLQAQYDQDHAALQTLLARCASLQASAAPVAANQNASTTDQLAAADSIHDLLSQAQAAGDLSWVDEHKKLADAEMQLQHAESDLRGRAAAAVQSEVDQLSAKVDALPAAGSATPATEAQLLAIDNRARQLATLSGLDDRTKAAVRSLAQKVDQRRQALQTTQQVAAELANIRMNAASPDDLQKALQAFVQKYPNDRRTADFTTALARMPLDNDVDLWRDMTADWAGQYAPSNANVSQKRTDAIAAYLSAHPESPMTATANAYSDYLKRAADALAEKGTWQTSLGDLFTNPMLAELKYIDTSDGQRFYILGDPDKKEGRMNSQVSISFTAIDPSDITKRMRVTVDPPTHLKTPDPVPTPHARLVQQLNDQIKLINASNWDTWGIDAADTVNGNKEINPVAKAILVQNILKTEETVAGWAIGDVYDQTLTDLGRIKPEQLPLTTPDKISEGTMTLLRNTLSAIPSAASVRKKLAAAKTTLFKAVAFDVQATGVLLKDDQGNWSVATRTVPTDGDLWTALPPPPEAAPSAPSSPSVPAAPPADSQPASTASAPAAAPAAPAAPASLVHIGSLHNGRFALYDNVLHDLPQGTLVYITTP